MARGQDAPNKSMQVDPYVQQSIMQGKEQANNRLIAAMQQASAGQRQKQAGTQQAVSQGMQMQQEQQMMAAQSAQQDKRAAEAEAARREDMKFQEQQNSQTQEFQAEQNKLQREFLSAQASDDREAEQRLRKDLLDAQQLQFRDNLEATERMVNSIVSMTKGMANNETAKQKFLTLADKEAQKTEQTVEMYEVARKNVIAGVKADKRMDLPPPTTTWGKMKRIKEAGVLSKPESGALQLIPTPGLTAAYQIAKGTVKTAEGGTADPMAVLSQFERNQSKINVGDLTPDTVSNLEKNIVNGEITAQDITSAWASIRGMKDVIAEKIADAKVNSPEEKFWDKQQGQLDLMESSISGLLNSKTKISGNETETVGARIRFALGPIEGFSLGSLIQQRKKLMKEAGVQDPFAMYNEFTKGIEPVKLEEYPEGASDYLKDLIDRRNASRIDVYPDLGGGQ